LTYSEYCAAVDRARNHPDNLRAGLDENGLRLTTCEAACALGYQPHMTHQIWPQRDALVCIVPKDLQRATWTEEAAAAARASRHAWLD
jgi:hypothetical protein